MKTSRKLKNILLIIGILLVAIGLCFISYTFPFDESDYYFLLIIFAGILLIFNVLKSVSSNKIRALAIQEMAAHKYENKHD